MLSITERENGFVVIKVGNSVATITLKEMRCSGRVTMSIDGDPEVRVVRTANVEKSLREHGLKPGWKRGTWVVGDLTLTTRQAVHYIQGLGGKL